MNVVSETYKVEPYHESSQKSMYLEGSSSFPLFQISNRSLYPSPAATEPIICPRLTFQAAVHRC